MPFFHPPKDHMFAIQWLSLGSAKEKLGTICVLSSICPGQDARMCIIHNKVFILKFLPIDGRAARAIMACEVATLSYESWDNCVRRGTLLSKSFLSSTQSTRLWSLELCKQLEGDVAQGLAMSENTVGMSLAAASGNRGQRRLQSPSPACLQDRSLCNLFLLKVRRLSVGPPSLSCVFSSLRTPGSSSDPTDHSVCPLYRCCSGTGLCYFPGTHALVLNPGLLLGLVSPPVLSIHLLFIHFSKTICVKWIGFSNVCSEDPVSSSFWCCSWVVQFHCGFSGFILHCERLCSA